MNTPIPAGMTIVDNRWNYTSKEISNRLAMPAKAFDLASLNIMERRAKGHKFQMNLRINRAVKERVAERKEVIAAALRLGIPRDDLL